MLPTVADGGVVSSTSPVVSFRRVPAVVSQLDEVLFAPGGWFALSVGNERVPGVVVASLAAGLGLVGQGPVASLVGRLRPGFRVVDVDVEGLQGHAIAEEVAGWCRGRGLWVLVRPSGGADGRTHVFVAAVDHVAALEEFVAEVRAAYKVSRSRVDVRVMVRPLSAPHRTGVETRPLGSVSAALADLLRRSPTVVARQPSAASRAASSVPLVPRRRRHEDLPAVWQTFLETGARPRLEEVEGKDYSRSTFEAMATSAMVRAGWTVEEAWAAVQAAHPLAMDHARRSQQRWVRHVWNRAVAADNQAPAPALVPDVKVAAAIDAARARLRAMAWNIPTRQRPALLRVGYAVLDRMERTNSLRVPVPERDLVLDTGIKDRATIRTQLRRLHRGVGFLDTTTFIPTARATSSFEFEIPPQPHVGGGVPQILPPRSHTPLPQRLPLDLPAAAWVMATVMALAPGREWTIGDLVEECQLVDRSGGQASIKRIRLAREALAGLARAGVVACRSTGGWVFVPSLVADLRERDDTWSDVLEQVASERREYRAGNTGGWQVARAAAIKRDRARQRAWWTGLAPIDRAARQTEYAIRFARWSVEDQHRFKVVAAQRSICEGTSPAARHQQWLYAMAPDDLGLVVVERAARFAALPQPLQVAYVRAWEAYRHDFDVPRGTWQVRSRRGEQSVPVQDLLTPSATLSGKASGLGD